jgi:hypothetical protein
MPLAIALFAVIFIPAALFGLYFLREKPAQAPEKPTTFGEADYLNLEDCHKLGLLEGGGIPLGFFSELKQEEPDKNPEWIYHSLHYSGTSI